MGNTGGEARPGRSAGPGVSNGLDRVREVARGSREARFTALLHHVSYLRLSLAFDALKKDAAPGVDGVTWREYDRNRQENLLALHARVRSGKYRAVPSRRACIPKADGRLRPLGIASLEDKIVQRAVCEVLNAVYEADFKGFSYGFRPGRSQHDALDALPVGLGTKVNWVLDADVRGFLDPCSHCSSADCVYQNRPSRGAGISIRRPFLLPVRVRTALRSPRLTFCKTAGRETPSARLAW